MFASNYQHVSDLNNRIEDRPDLTLQIGTGNRLPVHSESNDETNRAKDIFKEEGAHDISSSGEAHSDVKAEHISNTADIRVREVPSKSGLLESDIPSNRDSALRETERDL